LLKIETSISPDEVPQDIFFYLLLQELRQPLRRRLPKSATIALFGKGISEGSLLADIAVGAGMVGGTIALYPKISDGLQRMFEDGRAVTKAASTALRKLQIRMK